MSEPQSLISIDFWDTLVDGRTGGSKRRNYRIHALREVAANAGETLSDEEIEQTFQATSSRFHEVWFEEQRTMTLEELIYFTTDQLGFKPTQKETEWLAQKFDDSLWEGPPAIIPSAKEIIPQLAEIYQLAIISDTMFSSGKILRQYLENNKLLHYFNSFVFSDEVGYSKPNPKAYHKVLKETGSIAGQSYHIGDRLNTDIAGAKRVGMQAILFTGISMKSNKPAHEKEAGPDYRCESWGEVGRLLL